MCNVLSVCNNYIIKGYDVLLELKSVQWSCLQISDMPKESVFLEMHTDINVYLDLHVYR